MAPNVNINASLLEVSLGKRASRTGLEIALEADRPVLVRELNDDMKLPGPVPHSMRAAAVVVIIQPSPWIGRETGIEVGSGIRVSKDIYEALVSSHGDGWSKRHARKNRRNVADTVASAGRGRSSCLPERR